MASRGSNQWRLDAWGTPCELVTIPVPIYAGGPRTHIRQEIRDAYVQLGAVFQRHGYIVRRIGCYNCRRITGGTTHSSHSWGIAVDVNDDTNPYRRDRLVTDMSRAMIADVYAIRTVGGVQAWRWGGDWDGRPEVPNSNYDAMHFEIIATPSELARGFAAAIPKPVAVCAPPVTGASYPVLRRGGANATGPVVLELQRRLGMTGITGSGTFGPRTEVAVKLYQKSRGLEDDGVVGAGTWTALLTNQPPVPAGAPGPQKR